MKRVNNRSTIAAMLLTVLVLSGCARTATSRSSLTKGGALRSSVEQSAWLSIEAGHFRENIAQIGALPNAGLQLPVVSPDGRWIAALSTPDVEAVDPDALLTGRTIDRVSLQLFDAARPQAPPRLVATGAGWIVWAKDSQQLFAVAYDRSGRCGLIIYDLATAKTQRREIGLSHIVTPMLSPSGTTLAFAAFSQVAQQARIYTYDLLQRQLVPFATPKEMVWQIRPSFANEHALLYFGRVGSETGIFGAAAANATRDVRLAKFDLPLNAAEAIRSQSGIMDSTAGNGGWLATFAADDNRIALHHLDDSQSIPLEPASQAGMWAADQQARRFLYTTDKELRLYSPTGGSRLLASRPLVPLWCSAGGQTILAVAPGPTSWTFELIRLTIAPAAE